VVGSLEAPRAGTTLGEAVESARAGGALPIIPWGFGKWWGRRGSLLTRYLEQAGAEIFLGDNGGRPVLYGRPRHFELARRRGIPILPGSDPLPLPSETSRPGGYGFGFDGAMDPDFPSRSLKAEIRRDHFTPRPFGRGETPLRFARHQVLMQLRKRRSRGETR
jgi:hypothetical protein